MGRAHCYFVLASLMTLGLSSCRDERLLPTSTPSPQSGAAGAASPGSGTDEYYGFFPSRKGATFKLFRHNILGFEIDMPANWTFGVVGAPPNAVALLYPDGLNTAKLSPDWKTIELGALSVPGLSLADAAKHTQQGMNSKHPGCRVTHELASTTVGTQSAVTWTYTWQSKTGNVVTEKLYLVQFGKSVRSVAVRSASPDPKVDLAAGDEMVQTFVPKAPPHK